MHYLDAFECDYCEDIQNLINTCVEFHHSTVNDNYSNKSICSCNSSFTLFDVNQHDKKHSVSVTIIQKNQPDQTKLKAYFFCFPFDAIKNAFGNDSQCSHSPVSVILKIKFKYTFPVLSIRRLHASAATYVVRGDTPNIDNGSTSAQIFVGKYTLLTGVYSMKSDKHFTSTLSNNMCHPSTMGKIISNRKKS